ncbi:MAG: class I SAM-dependent methyltransferase [Candidatus Marinimicrobia bacterium]|nr:class I SAM-dependent methyltransferase [Candidatus Neomarinimicrobiota bacterium]
MENFDKKYWAQRAGQYNKTNWVRDEDFLAAFVNLLPHKNFDKVLEAGIGTGVVAEKMAEIFGEITGVDISADMIKNINHPKINAEVGDLHNLPFQNGEFDLIYMRNVIHYLHNPAMVFQQISRCLTKEGYFLFSQVIPPDDSISDEYDYLVGRDIHYPTQREILDLYSIFENVEFSHFILKRQSIMNWLNNTCENDNQKQIIIQRHEETSTEYKRLANYQETEEDILVDIKHLMLLGRK